MREIKAWLMQFVARIELGYNRARIFYTYPAMDLLTAGEHLRSTLPLLGGTNESGSTGSFFKHTQRSGGYDPRLLSLRDT